MDILNDHIFGTTLQAKTLAQNDTLITCTENGLVATNIHTDVAGFVVCDLNGTLIVITATELYSVLATISGVTSTLEAAARFGNSALRTEEIERLIDHDGTGCIITDPRLESDYCVLDESVYEALSLCY